MTKRRWVSGRNITTAPRAATVMNVAYPGSKTESAAKKQREVATNHAGRMASTGTTAVRAEESILRARLVVTLPSVDRALRTLSEWQKHR